VDLEQNALEAAINELALGEATIAWGADITRRDEVDEMADEVERRFGRVDILVNAAGTNTKQRTLEDMSPEQWEEVVAVNLSGVFHCTHALLPLMRSGGGGNVVNIISTAALLVSPGVGTHYSAAKRGLLSLTESINIEQGRHGVRACAIIPGEVDTPLIDKRPEAPSAERRAGMLRPEDVAEAVYYVVTRPARVTISEIIIWPSAQAAGLYAV
jgi:NAD(P)-dependent dehydrogenase (short-subunit alcohol dehydrogenase family)